MALISRGTKANGSTSLADGEVVYADELNTDFDAIIDEFNGNIDNANVKAAAGIVTTKIDDYSSTVTVMGTETNPGTSGSESQPTTLAGELERLRYVVRRIASGGQTVHYNGTTTAATYWGDQTVRGPNICRNGGFEVKTTGSTAAPDGWTIFGSPTTCTQATTPVSNGKGKSLRIVADAATEGIYQTLTGLKASTLYFIQARYIVSAGSMLMTTTGALASGSFRDVSITKTTATWSTVSAMVSTDTTPNDIVLAFVSTANGDDFQIDDVVVMEVGREISHAPGSITVRDSSSATGLIPASLGVFPTGDGLSAAVTVPCHGCRITVSAKCQVSTGANDPGGVLVVLYETPTSTGTAVQRDATCDDIDVSDYRCLPLGYANTSPTPGETYTYSVYHTGASAVAAAISNGSVFGATLESWLEVTLHVPA